PPPPPPPPPQPASATAIQDKTAARGFAKTPVPRQRKQHPIGTEGERSQGGDRYIAIRRERACRRGSLAYIKRSKWTARSVFGKGRKTATGMNVGPVYEHEAV